ncbi:MAG: beta-lactamase family protein [Clostridia bacterium]|nr:beta-lactamase family protein [Clostridia bacterium]
MYNFSSLEKYLDTILVKEKVPGFDCKVLHKGKEVFRYQGGYKDRENKIPMKGDELFMLYSASKPITCAAGLRAMEEGKFLMGHPLWWYLPAFKDVKIKRYDEQGNMTLEPAKDFIRIHDIFNMTAGLNYDCGSKEIREAVKSNPSAPTLEIANAIAKMGLDFEPGTRWQYSLCHDIVAALVEASTGEKFRDYVKRVIFNPLVMEAYYHMTPEIEPRVATQYQFDYSCGEAKLVEKKNGYIFGEEYDSGGAGVITSVDDYAKFAYAMTNYGVGANGARILSKASVNLMRTNTLPLDSQMYKDFSSWMSNHEYGYGFGVRTKIGVGRGGNLTSIGEFGWDGAAGFLCSIDPEKQITIVYAQQMLNPQHDCIHNKIKNIVNTIIE